MTSMMMLLKCRTHRRRLTRMASNTNSLRHPQWALQASLSTHRRCHLEKPAWHARTLQHNAQPATNVQPVRLLTSRSTMMTTRSSRLDRRNGRQQVIHWADLRVPTIPQHPYPSRSGLRLTFRSPLRETRHTDRSALDNRCAHLRCSRHSLVHNHQIAPRHSRASLHLLRCIMPILAQNPKAQLWVTGMDLSAHRYGHRRRDTVHHSRLWANRVPSLLRLRNNIIPDRHSHPFSLRD
jgi:hypothetical protein